MKIVKVDTENVDVRTKDNDEDHLVAVIGLKDVLVVKGKGVTVIAKKDDNLVEQLLDLVVELAKTKGEKKTEV